MEQAWELLPAAGERGVADEGGITTLLMSFTLSLWSFFVALPYFFFLPKN